MDIEIRTVERGELGAVRHLDAVLFGYAEEADKDDPLGELLEPDRLVAAFDGGRMVGISAGLSLELTVPGGAQVRMAGITWVGVLMTHRRRGIMRRLMTEQLERMEATGESVAGLGASQSLLYRRFGFGPASRAAHIEMETLHAGFSQPWQDHGSVWHIELDEALEVIPELHARVRRTRNGMASRTPVQHRNAYKDAAKEKDGAGPIRFVIHRDATGALDGVAAYRFRLSFDAGDVHDGDLRVVELLAATEEANAALWRFCLDHDLVKRVVAPERPVDDPVTDRLADPRRWTPRLKDDLHLRPVDVPALLAARRYAREDTVTLDVRDPLLERLGGRFRLEGGLEGAICERVHSAPDLTLGTAALGSIYLGDTTVERLARASLVEELTPGAVRRATAMFAWSPLPWTSYMF